MTIRYNIIFTIAVNLPLWTLAQLTTGSVSGIIRSGDGPYLPGVTVTILHEPTSTLYFTQTTKAGVFAIFNLLPGGPYTVEASALNYAREKKTGLFVTLGESLRCDMQLIPQIAILPQVMVSAMTHPEESGRGIIITRDRIALVPSAGRNMHDYLRTARHASLVQGVEGAISFAAQNNRYNSFNIDGAVNNEVFGLAASGTNGGQAGISPIPSDAVEQLQVNISPYDVSLGNFTGAAINAVTRSGTNRNETSFYYFITNPQFITRASFDALETEGLLKYSGNTSGMRTSGAIIKNKIFYFFNAELQRDVYPHSFSFSNYSGTTQDINTLHILSNTLKGTYHYDAGSFTGNPGGVNAGKTVARVDWNMNRNHKLAISVRHSEGERFQVNESSANTIHFSNDGYSLKNSVNSLSAELKSAAGPHASNKLSVTFSGVSDDREPLGRAFPRVRINDGIGAIILGTDNSSTINLLTQRNWNLFDKFTITRGKHLLGMGVEMEYNRVRNAFIQNSFGNYTYASISDFLTGRKPSGYQLGFPVADRLNNDQTAAAAKFEVARISAFLQDELRCKGLIVEYGIRIDKFIFLTSPAGDDYTNMVAIPAFRQYYNLEGAQSGARIRIPMSVSPRVGFTYTMGHVKLRGGFGIFSGRVPLAWPGGAFNNNGLNVGGFMAGYAELNRIRFRPDPYGQWTPGELGAAINKEPLNLITHTFQMPEIFRASLTAGLFFGNGWSFNLETIYSRNIQEIAYTNINLLPPADHASGIDNRLVYTSVNNARIPLNADGSNPFGYSILLGNQRHRLGNAISVTTGIYGHWQNNWHAEAQYQFANATINNEGTSSINVTQWRNMESVNGRNQLERSVSDFSSGHGLLVILHKKFEYTGSKMNTTLSIVYTGRAGSPVSYVYGINSMTRDDGTIGAYDLLYIPSPGELSSMVFLPNTVNGITYSPQQQKDAWELYIQRDPYLLSHRGSYAQRNGSRTPSSHVVDIAVTHQMRIKAGNKYHFLQISFEVFNFTNLVNRNWGHRYLQPNDNLSPVVFAGYAAANDLTPAYRFDPGLLATRKWTLSSGASPAYSAVWNTQIGIRISL